MGTRVDGTRQSPQTGNLSVKIAIDETHTGILDSADLVRCYFIEDIFGFCMMGKLIFYDRSGLMEYGPFTGNETISLVYGTEEEREIVFHIWRVKRIVQVKQGGVQSSDENLIEVVFVDNSYGATFEPKYSRSFGTDKTYMDIVNHILKNMIGWPTNRINLEQSNSKPIEGFVIPYWSPAKTINWILKRCISTETASSGYLCYGNTYNERTINIRTLNYLFGENNVLDDVDYVFGSSDDSLKNKVLEWHVEGANRNAMGKVLGGTWKGFNPATKKLISTNYNFTEGIKDTVLLGRQAVLPNITDATLGSSVEKVTGEASEAELKAFLYDEWARQYNRQNAIIITVEGNEKRYAGHQIQIRWPSADKVSQIYHKQYQGKYLVKSITHHFTARTSGSSFNYTQKMVLLKNGFQDGDAISLVNASKQNTQTRNKYTFVRA
jgi:hypothetical protein